MDPLASPRPPTRTSYCASLWEVRVITLTCQVSFVVDEMRAQRMYDDTLIVFSADNGGPIYKGGAAAANNWPLRGGKAVSPPN